MDLIPFSLSNYTLENYLVKIGSGSKIIYWIIIGTVIFGIAALPLIYVDVSVQARGYFQSDIEKQTIYSPFQGKIIFTSIQDGSKIHKGDTLFIIDSESLKAQQKSLLQQIEENNSESLDLILLTKIETGSDPVPEPVFSTSKYLAEYRNFRKQEGIQVQKYRNAKTVHERNEVLFKQKIIPDADFENTLFALNVEKENLNQILFYQKSLWQAGLTQRKNERLKLDAGLKQFTEELNNRIVLSPVNGEILETIDIQRGSMVSLNQKIAEISPDGNLVATCFVKPADIGLINETQKVKIQVDAFNYNEWGMIEGSIIDISDDMIIENGSAAYFRIKCKPLQEFLSLRSGTKAFIKKGMSLNARVVVTRRNLFNLLFDKADKWFNPYTYTKE
jgi:membrane fusion protein, peptide pheromone/bacteriocin exporter